MKAIGIDIGGTFIKYGLVDDKGKVIELDKMKVEKNYPDKTLSILSNNVLKLIKKHKCKVDGIGVGMPGILENGKILDITNLPKWKYLNISKIIYSKTKIKTHVCNDASVAALAEAKFGSAKGVKDVIMLTLGTGVGGGLILNSKLYEGNKGQGAELGHMTIDFNGLKCPCGRRGCVEMYCSATALTNQAKEEMKKNKKSLMWKLVNNNIDKVDASIPFIAELKHDTSAKKVIDKYIMYLGETILDYCDIFRPEIIILGGGVANQKKNLTDRVTKYLEKYYYGIKGAAKVKIVTPKLGYEAGVVGAASLILNK